MGDPGCLSGDTIVSVRRGAKPKKMPLKNLFRLHRGFDPRAAAFNRTQRTALLADLGGFVGTHYMNSIVSSGKKPLFRLSAGSAEIKATADHQFLSLDGWVPLSTLSSGSFVSLWRNRRTKAIKARGPGDWGHGERVTIYSIPYHPYAQDNYVAGRNYKRNPRSKMVLEAAMNNLSLEEFVQILRNSPGEASSLSYLVEEDIVIHHLNGNPTDDRVENLQIVSAEEHNNHHHEALIQAANATEFIRVSLVEEVAPEETYDIVMEDPYRNFIANGFVVHNSGKTGSLASLVAAGYKLRVYDFDNLLQPLLTYAKAAAADKLGNVAYQTFTDAMEGKAAPAIMIGGRMSVQPFTVGIPTAFVGGLKQLTHWKTPEEDLGDPSKWGRDTFVIIDTLTSLSLAAFRYCVALNPMAKEPQTHYFSAQQMVMQVLTLLGSEQFNTNVLVLAHVQYQENHLNLTKGFPRSIGSALNSQIGGCFNCVLLAETKSPSEKVIRTKSTGIIDLKNPVALNVPDELPLATGLATIAKAVLEGV